MPLNRYCPPIPPNDHRIHQYILPRTTVFPQSLFSDPKEDLDDIINEDLYPFKVVEEDGVMGSCSTYKTRKIIQNFSQEKMKDENSIVFVASQTEREKALLGSQYDPLLIRSFASMAYALLERIGRAR